MPDSAQYHRLGACVKYHRKQSGLTQAQLAQLAGVAKGVVFDLEHGKQSFQINSLLKVLHTLNIELILQSPLMTHFDEDYNAQS